LWAALALIAAGIAAVLYVLFAASSKPQTAGGLTRLATGEMANLRIEDAPPPMPTRALQNADGQDVTLQAYDGEVLVVNLWATWCAPCMEEMPTLGALQRRFEGRLRVIPISVDSAADLEKAESELARLAGGSLPFLSDISRGVLFDVRAPGMPTTLIYDRNGNEVARLPGAADWGGDDAAAVMDVVLAEQ
jgi:thiol-disulfide isomerase/thioredoxin